MNLRIFMIEQDGAAISRKTESQREVRAGVLVSKGLSLALAILAQFEFTRREKRFRSGRMSYFTVLEAELQVSIYTDKICTNDNHCLMLGYRAKERVDIYHAKMRAQREKGQTEALRAGQNPGAKGNVR